MCMYSLVRLTKHNENTSAIGSLNIEFQSCKMKHFKIIGQVRPGGSGLWYELFRRVKKDHKFKDSLGTSRDSV